MQGRGCAGVGEIYAYEHTSTRIVVEEYNIIDNACYSEKQQMYDTTTARLTDVHRQQASFHGHNSLNNIRPT